MHYLFKKQTSNYKEKSSNFAANRDHSYKKQANKSNHLYTCRYSSGHLIPIINHNMDKLGITKYLQVYR